MTLLDSAETLRALAALPGNRLEALRGNRAGRHSIRIDAQWRICFRWTDEGPCDVGIVDYHRVAAGGRGARRAGGMTAPAAAAAAG